jgi:hypothetical protein
MCMFKPKIPKQVPGAERQAMQMPKESVGTNAAYRRRRRGMWASIFTSPQGISTVPTVTGGAGGVTGG